MMFVVFCWNLRSFWIITPRSFVVASCWSGVLLNESLIVGCVGG